LNRNIYISMFTDNAWEIPYVDFEFSDNQWKADKIINGELHMKDCSG